MIISPFQFRLRRGIERFTYSLSNQLAADYNLDIIIYSWENDERVNWGDWHKNIKIRKVPYLRYYQNFLAKLFYYFWVRKDSPTAVLINFLYHGEYSLPKNLNFYYVLHSPASLIQHRYEYIEKYIQHFRNLRFIAVSDYIRDEARSFIQDKEIVTINHGVDFKIFNQCVTYIDKPGLKIITTSALEEWKGIQDIIEALSENEKKNQFRLDIFGDGPYKNSLIRLINKLDLKDTISIKPPVGSLENVLPDYDIFCQMSIGDAFGLSLFEALACGLPSVVYDTPPFDRLLPKDVVKKVPKKSIKKINSALFDYLDSSERELYGTRAYNFVRNNFGLDKMASNYFGLIE